MIKKTVYRSSGRRVRGEDDKIPSIKTAAPDLPLDVLRNMDIRFDFVVCMHPLVQRERLADVRGARAHLHTSCDVGASAPHTPERVARTSDGTMFRVTSGWPPATGSPHALV